MNKIDLNNVEIIGNGAFGGRTELEKIVLPNTLKAIGNDVFSCCHLLNDITNNTSIVIDNSILGTR